MNNGMPGFGRAEAEWENKLPEDYDEECMNLMCGECAACKEADREDAMERAREAAEEDRRFG